MKAQLEGDGAKSCFTVAREAISGGRICSCFTAFVLLCCVLLIMVELKEVLWMMSGLECYDEWS